MRHRFSIVLLCCLSLIPTAAGVTRRVPADFPFIQSAINASDDGDIVLVANGTYSGAVNTNLRFDGRSITVQSENGPDYCIIDCLQSARAFLFDSGETQSAVVDGFTIRNGRTTGSDDSRRGGAIYCIGAGPTILTCIFEDNYSEAGGGAIAIGSGAHVRIAHCTFDGNSSQRAGGAILNRGEADIIDSDFTFNFSSTSGGGLAILDGRGEYAYLRIDYNQAYLVGGGVFITNIFQNNFYNCRISWNGTGAEGAGVYSAYARPAFYNCTIGSNTSTSHGGIYAEGTYAPVLMNCIVYGNGGPGLFSDTTPMIVTYSDIEWTNGQTYPGTGNMNIDPLFVTDFLRLSHIAAGQSADSPCINSGSSSASSMCVSTFRGSWCLNEFSTRTDALPDTGTVDMGFHVLSNLPTPTPSPTPTITRTPTPTPTVTPTPTSTPALCDSGFFDYLLMAEYFTSWPPAGWTIRDNDEFCQWESNFTCSRINTAGYETLAACCDNSWCGSGARYRTDLVSPLLDLTDETDARLEFTVSFENEAQFDILRVYYTINSGTPVELFDLNEDITPEGPGGTYYIDLTPVLGNSGVQLQFTYHSASLTGYILLDNIFVKVCRSGASPTPTSVPPTSTHPPVPTWTPTPVPTQPCSTLGCSIRMPSVDFGAGDPCSCTASICNPDSTSLGVLPVFVILDVYGLYFFAPDFSDFNYYSVDVIPGLQTIDVLPQFDWPAGTGSASGINWYAGITNPEMTALIGDFGFFTFGWH